MRLSILFTILALSSSFLVSQTIRFSQHSAVVWSQDHTITGTVDTVINPTGIVYQDGAALPVTFSGTKQFSVTVHLHNGVNSFVAAVDSGGITKYSDTLRFTLGYKAAPEIYAYADISSGLPQLHAVVVSNPDTVTVSYQWFADARNPATVFFATPGDSVTAVTLSQGSPSGEYYFTVSAFTSAGDTVTARTFITVGSSGIRPFDIRNDHAGWIDSAIIYGITPYNFVAEGHYSDITKKIPEIAQLGVTAIWLQPVYATYGGGQGYDVTDYFGLRSDLGSEADLRRLVETAHQNGLRVLFDFVPNHSSLYHPYAQDAIAYGSASHYYDFYQRTFDSAPYASNYNYLNAGKMRFVYYFWNNLVNLNYSNPEVQRMIIEAGKYWIRKFDIDGYRIDAVWGPNARNPNFMKSWRLALKEIKPEALLLGEDKASQAQAFDQRFDVAYDWTAEYGWVSHWVWEATYSSNSNPTIFNYTPVNSRAAALRSSLTNNGQGYASKAKVFRFMENNDTYRFLATHDLPRTKMAALLMYSLAGIPSIYNGQEIGFATIPYNTYSIFTTTRSIKSQDRNGLFSYYQQLNALRRKFPALLSNNFQEIPVTPNDAVFAWRRWEGDRNIFGVINMAPTDAGTVLTLPVQDLQLDAAKIYYLTDVLSGIFIAGTPSQLAAVNIPVPGYTTRLFWLADTLSPTALQALNISFNDKWNIVSVPVTVHHAPKDSLFPSSISGAYRYQDGYTIQPTLENGTGYWLKYNGAQSVVMTGIPIFLDSISVTEGWNLIGSISSPLAVGTITSDPPNIVTSGFYGYTAGYATVDSLLPGKGYWVKLSEAGKLYVASGPAPSVEAGNAIRIVSTGEMPPPPPDGGKDEQAGLPKIYALQQNYPNPFNPATTIRYQLPSASHVKLTVHNMIGQQVAVLVDGEQEAGYKQVEFNAGSTADGLASGIYFYKLSARQTDGEQTGSFNDVRKFAIIK